MSAGTQRSGVWGVGGASSVQGRGLGWIFGVQGTRGARPKDAVRACDPGRVETQWLVKRLCALLSRKKGMQSGARCGLAGGRAVGRVRAQGRA